MLGVVLLPMACSGRTKVYRVTGRVLFQGRPAAGAVVQFHPEDASDKNLLVPQGQVGPDGSFKLTTYRHDDGAPAGHYAVSVFWAVPSKGGDNFDKILVPERYLNPATSGLSAEVPARAIDLPPFQLSK
jgi:hypothetical protein